MTVGDSISAGAIAVYALSLVLAIVFTLIFLHRYHRKVLKLQRDSMDGLLVQGLSEPKQTSVESSGKPPLEIAYLNSSTNRSWFSWLSFDQIDRLAYRKSAIYFVGGMAYSAVLAISWVLLLDSDAWLGKILFVCYLFFFVVIHCLIATLSRLGTLLVLFAYMLVFGMLVEGAWGYGFGIFKNINIFMLILLLVFINRRMRAIGYMCFAFFFSTLIGAYSLRQIGQLQNKLSDWLGVGPFLDFLLSLILAAPLFAILGWYFLKHLGDRYHLKNVSDEKMMIDTMVFTSAFGHALMFFTIGFSWIFVALAAFFSYFVVTGILFKLLISCDLDRANPTSILYLRVFDLAAKGERLFTAFSKRWRLIGNINLISGTDLIKSTIEPHEFFEYLSGRITRQFVRDETDLMQRLEAIDALPDPDGRYRVNEFFCYDNTWRMTMQSLSSDCDVVLMDLRSFSAVNRGCVYELEQLLNLINLDRVVFLVDKTTDSAYLENQLLTLWSSVELSSPNIIKQQPVVKMYRYRNSLMGRSLLDLEQALFSSSATVLEGISRA